MNKNQSLAKLLMIPAIVTAILLLIPLIAMQFSNEVDWSPMDFVVAGILLFGTGAAYKLISSKVSNVVYKIAVAAACASGLFLIWTNLAVGLIGSENNPVNLIYSGMVLLAFIASFIVKFRANFLTYIMFALAGGLILLGSIILIAAGMNNPEFDTDRLHIFFGVHGFFIVQFVISGLLFHRAAREIQQADKAEN